MKMKMIKAGFAGANAAVSKVVLKDILSPFSRVLLGVTDGNLSLTGCSNDMQLTCRMACESEETGAVSLPGARLAAFAGAMPDGVIELATEGSDKAVLSGGGVKYRLSVNDAADFPAMKGPDDGAAKVHLSALLFREMLRKVKFAVSVDGTRKNICGVNMKMAESLLAFTATDGSRLAHVEHDAEVEGAASFDVTIPTKAVGVLWDMLGKEPEGSAVEFSADSASARFTGDSWMLTVKVIDGTYPDWRRVIPGNPEHHAKIDRVAFLEALERAALAMDEADVKIVFSNGKISFAAQGQLQNAEISIGGCTIEDGAKGTFHFNPKLLSDALSAIDENEFDFGFGWGGAGCTTCIIKCSVPWTYAVMPLRKA